MVTKEQSNNGVVCKGICIECNDRFECYQSNYEPTKDEKFAFEFHKEHSKEILILAMGNYQKMHVEASNRAYKLEKSIKELVAWIEKEITAVESEDQKYILRRVLSEIKITGMVEDK